MKMNDSELLELAAKAARVEVLRWNSGQEPYSSGEGFILPSLRIWNPLKDDGDALRLAVKLRIGIEINERSVIASWLVDGEYETRDVYEYPDSIQDNNFDIVHVNHEKATRRAIVRAAAEIVRQMQEVGAA